MEMKQANVKRGTSKQLNPIQPLELSTTVLLVASLSDE